MERRSQREREFLPRLPFFFTFFPGTNPFLFIFAPPTLASLLFLVTSTGCLCSRRAKSRREPCNSNCTRPLPLCRLHPPHHPPVLSQPCSLAETRLSRSLRSAPKSPLPPSIRHPYHNDYRSTLNDQFNRGSKKSKVISKTIRKQRTGSNFEREKKEMKFYFTLERLDVSSLQSNREVNDKIYYHRVQF